MHTLRNLTAYFKRHPGYIVHLICDLFKLFWYKCTGRKILVITTGSGGIGDYLWIRSYYPLIHQKGYKIILIAMSHWSEIVETFDKKNVDIIRYFESCLSPKKIESLLFKLFKFDVFLNFRKNCMADIVRNKKEYNDTDILSDLFYEERNNKTFCKFTHLPKDFRHHLPIIEPKNKTNNYVILVEKGNTQGRLSDRQLSYIINYLVSKSYNILYNGDYDHIISTLSHNVQSKIIDGREYSFPQYTWLVSNALFIVTVNTALYHFAVQLNRPCVVISNNEYHTLNLYHDNQAYVFNTSLQNCYEAKHISTYKVDPNSFIENIEPERIVKGIQQIESIINSDNQTINNI